MNRLFEPIYYDPYAALFIFSLFWKILCNVPIFHFHDFEYALEFVNIAPFCELNYAEADRYAESIACFINYRHLSPFLVPLA